MSNDPEQEFFVDGLTEEILNAIVGNSNLKVVGRTSSFQYKNTNQDLRLIGQSLGVKYLLEGSVRKQPNQVRITAQLIRVKDGFHVWSERYDSEPGDIFGIQDSIAHKVAEKLQSNFTINSQNTPKTQAVDFEEFSEYLKAKFYLNRALSLDPGNYETLSLLGIAYGNEGNHRQAVEYFQKAIEADPGIAQAYVNLGKAQMNAGQEEEARINFQKAVQIDPDALNRQ